MMSKVTLKCQCCEKYFEIEGGLPPVEAKCLKCRKKDTHQ